MMKMSTFSLHKYGKNKCYNIYIAVPKKLLFENAIKLGPTYFFPVKVQKIIFLFSGGMLYGGIISSHTQNDSN